jgi:hypothetical protein
LVLKAGVIYPGLKKLRLFTLFKTISSGEAASMDKEKERKKGKRMIARS